MMSEKIFRKPSARITEILAENLRSFRRQRNISQEELADLCDVHRTYVGSVERGERNVTLSTLELIAGALDVSIPELLTSSAFDDRSDKLLNSYVINIRKSRLSIYDPINIGDPALWIPSSELELLLDNELKGISLAGLPLRTRSKVVKINICSALGYPVPKSFKKTQPRFPGQFFDIYIQKSNNLQVWNEELSGARRYVIIRVSNQDAVTKVKVVTGETLAFLDTTGTLTKKYQARCIPGVETKELITAEDTTSIQRFTSEDATLKKVRTPVTHPGNGELLPIQTVFRRLSVLVGQSFADAGMDQERNRGAALHRLVCGALGYHTYQDDGQFPDIRHQLIEVKLQTSSTIDLGLVCPDSTYALDLPMIDGVQVRHCDVRYAIFYAKNLNKLVTITHLLLTTGEHFFSRFPQFGGKILNAKLQIPLPRDFFGS